MRRLSIVLLGVVASAAFAGCGKAEPVERKMAHIVEVEEPRFVESKSTLISMSGTIDGTSSDSAGVRDFKIRIRVPAAVKLQVSVGAVFDVELPLLAGLTRRVSVTKMNDQILELSLKNEIHDLAGQMARLRLPVGTATVFEVPIAALFSPMGRKSFVFKINGNRAEQVPVEILNSAKNGMVLVVSEKIGNSSQIASSGLDNLIDGDLVQIGEKHARTK